MTAIMISALELGGQVYYRFKNDTWLWQANSPGIRFTPYGLWEHRPDVKAERDTDVNGFVHNGYNRPIAADHERFLIFVLGGSTVYGSRAPSNETTFPAQLERQLNERKPGCCRVINAGFPAFIAYQELGVIEGRLSQQYEPDLVLALDGRNDAVEVAIQASWKPNWDEYYDEVSRDVNRLLSPPVLVGPAYWLPRLSSIAYYSYWHAIRPVLGRREDIEVSKQARKSPAPASVVQAAVDAYLTNHEVAHLRLARRGIPYYVLLQPTLSPLLRRRWRDDEQAYMPDFWARRHVSSATYYGGVDAFYARACAGGRRYPWFADFSRLFDAETGRVYVDSCHYTVLANLELAKATARFLVARTNFVSRRAIARRRIASPIRRKLLSKHPVSPG